ncbi:MAG: hypothetical protein IMX01_06225 [Limnochordaceae bacterium]|nr:hypothetical protein [Limnochordaceae bacterium]
MGTVAGGSLAGRQLERLALEKEELEVERQDLIHRSQILDGRRLPVGETTVELRVRSVYVTEIVTLRLQLIAPP